MNLDHSAMFSNLTSYQEKQSFESRLDSETGQNTKSIYDPAQNVNRI